MLLLPFCLSMIGACCCFFNALSEPASTSNRILLVGNSNSTNSLPNIQLYEKEDPNKAKINQDTGKTVSLYEQKMKLFRSKKLPLTDVREDENSDIAILKHHFLKRTKDIQNFSKSNITRNSNNDSPNDDKNSTALPGFKTVIKEIYLNKNESDFKSIIGVVCCVYNAPNLTNCKNITQFDQKMKPPRTKNQPIISDIYEVSKNKSKCKYILKQKRRLKDVIITRNTEKSSILKQNWLKSYSLMRARNIQNFPNKNKTSKKINHVSYEEERKTVLPDSETFIKEIYLNENETDFKSIQELCEKFEIPITNCSCDNEFIIAVLKSLDIPITREICNVNKTIPTPITYQLVYDKLASRIYATITMVLIPIAFFGNCLVIFVNKQKQKLSRYEFLTTQLAVYDIIYTVVKAILTVPSFKTNHWVFDDVSCIVLPSLMKICWFLGVGLTTIIAIERFTGIMYPFRHAKNRTLIVMSTMNIAFAFLTAFPLSWRLKVDKHFQICTDLWVNSSSEIIYSIFLLIVYSIFPTFLILTIYFMLIANLKSQIRKNALGFKKSSLQRKKRIQQNIRITNVLLVTIVLYAFTTSPQRAVSLYHLLDNQTGKKFMKISFLALLPYPFHLAVNPVLYSMIDAKWRKDCKRLLKKMFRIKS